MATATSNSRTAPARRTEPLRLPRTTGALSGILVIALAIWGGLIVFVGPYFHYAFGGYQTWHFTSQRLWLEVLPAVVALIGGFLLLTSSSRTGGLLGGWLAVAAGAWFVVGPVVSLLWHHTIYAIGTPAGGNTRQMLEWIGFFYGVGALMIGLSAFAMGRYFSRPRIAGEAAAVAADAVEADRAHHAGRRAAVADAPAERAAVADRPVERDAVADRPLERETVASERPVEHDDIADRPLERETAADPSLERDAVADYPAERGTASETGAADAPAERGAMADAPTQSVPTNTGGGATYSSSGSPAGATATQTTGTRRSGGLLGRFRRR